MNKLDRKVVVITGGTSGIGLACAHLFEEEGAQVVLFARGTDGLKEAARSSRTAHCVQGDVTRSEDLERLFRETKDRFGRVDVVLANAAVVKLSPIGDTNDDLFDEVVATNMKGVFNTLRYSIPVLTAGASFVVMTSFLTRMGFAGSSVVAMTKGGLRSLVRVAAAELGPANIRVNALCPGAIETPLWGKLGLPPDVLQADGEGITAQIPLQRWGKPEEMARAALFLACNDSSYMNGAELEVDGGFGQA
ncbi:MAG TPA: SDR family oxidoreductase [Bryobacteraceae bacterium]|nr:SDR family oxidoreductase [Bryobacteraceae bacterium]